MLVPAASCSDAGHYGWIAQTCRNHSQARDQALEDWRPGLILADVSGKEMAAALLMSSTRSIVRLLAEDGSSPAEVLRRINPILLKDLPAARVTEHANTENAMHFIIRKRVG